MTTVDSKTQTLMQIWNAAVAAVSGYQAVAHALSADSSFNPELVLAVGKAAVGMCQGALDNLPPCDALVVTKYDHADTNILTRDRVRVIEAAHPIPDQSSLEAGQALLEQMRAVPEIVGSCCWSQAVRRRWPRLCRKECHLPTCRH